jgi:hypothetical protein
MNPAPPVTRTFMNVSVPSWPEAAGPRESREGESSLKLLQGDHTFATFACKHSGKTAIRRRKRVAGINSPDVSGGKLARHASESGRLFRAF